MRILFIHPNFPGQFRHLATWLAKQPGNQIVGLGENDALVRQRSLVPGVQLRGYILGDFMPTHGLHHYLVFPEACVKRGIATMSECHAMRKLGFEPDLIITHPGWGDALFLRQIYPDVPIIGYLEYYYNPNGADIGFDPEFPATLDNQLEVHMKNVTQLLTLQDFDIFWSPTHWQAQQFPIAYKKSIHVIHDGIDTSLICPNPSAVFTLPDGRTLRAGDEVLTFVNRCMEPYRGFHIFMRTLPEIQRRCPKAITVISGTENEFNYGNGPRADANGYHRTWKQLLLEEVGNQLDMNRIIFTGMLPFEQHLKLLQISRAHVYMTYPYILSWSMIEAMAAGCLVIGSRTPPVEEVIRDRENGLLFDFFNRSELADIVEKTLVNPQSFAEQREQARLTAIQQFDLMNICLPQQLTLIKQAKRRTD